MSSLVSKTVRSAHEVDGIFWVGVQSLVSLIVGGSGVAGVAGLVVGVTSLCCGGGEEGRRCCWDWG